MIVAGGKVQSADLLHDGEGGRAIWRDKAGLPSNIIYETSRLVLSDIPPSDRREPAREQEATLGVYGQLEQKGKRRKGVSKG